MQSPLTSAAASTLTKAKPSSYLPSHTGSLRGPLLSRLTSSDGTCIDEEELPPALPAILKKPVVKKVSFDSLPIRESPLEELPPPPPMCAPPLEPLPAPTHEVALTPNTDPISTTNTACPDNNISVAKLKPPPVGVLDAKSSFINENSDIIIADSDIILPPPPLFDTRDRMYSIEDISKALPPSPPPKPRKPLKPMKVCPPLPPVDFDSNSSIDSDVPPPVNLATLPPRTSLHSDLVPSILSFTDNSQAQQLMDEVFITRPAPLPPPPQQSSDSDEPSNPFKVMSEITSPSFPPAVIVDTVRIISAPEAVPVRPTTPVFSHSFDTLGRERVRSPELIQVHLATLPTVSHIPNVPCSLHPDETQTLDYTQPRYTAPDAYYNMPQSATFPITGKSYSPISTVSGAYNPYMVRDTSAPLSISTLPKSPARPLSSVEVVSSESVTPDRDYYTLQSSRKSSSSEKSPRSSQGIERRVHFGSVAPSPYKHSAYVQNTSLKSNEPLVSRMVSPYKPLQSPLSTSHVFSENMETRRELGHPLLKAKTPFLLGEVGHQQWKPYPN